MREAAVSVRELARAILGRNPKLIRRVAVLSTYLDGGGSVGDPSSTVFTVAGYLGTDDQWAGFESDWQSVLERFDVPAFTMKHCAHFKGAFAGWKGDEKRRGLFLEELSRTIHKHDLEGFAFSLNMDHYREIDKHLRLTESYPPYALTATCAVAKIRDWQRRYRSTDSLLFLFELGDIGQGLFKHKMENEWEPETGIMKPVFMPKQWVENGATKHSLPLQAADFLAYETNKALSDFLKKGKTTVRESAFRLSYKDGMVDRQPTNAYLEAKHIMSVAKAYRVRPRKRT